MDRFPIKLGPAAASQLTNKMGRYAFFSSGLEYKFAFGVQDSQDIKQFGGKDIGMCQHSWGQEDKETILERLSEIDNENELNITVKWEKYPLTTDGTHTLRDDIWNNLKNLRGQHNYAARYTYILGCLIYHQLLSNETLTVEYEP